MDVLGFKEELKDLNDKQKQEFIKRYMREYNGDISEGNFMIGNIIHEKIQNVYKKNHPEVDYEFTVIIDKNRLDSFRFMNNDIQWTFIMNDITLKGSIDIINRYTGTIIDIKTASGYTMPNTIQDVSPTYINQLKIYAAIYNTFLVSSYLPKITKYILIMVKKDNLQTLIYEFDHNPEDDKEIIIDVIERVITLHNAITNETIPQKEPNKWCKYCKYKKECE